MNYLAITGTVAAVVAAATGTYSVIAFWRNRKARLSIDVRFVPARGEAHDVLVLTTSHIRGPGVWLQNAVMRDPARQEWFIVATTGASRAARDHLPSWLQPTERKTFAVSLDHAMEELTARQLGSRDVTLKVALRDGAGGCYPAENDVTLNTDGRSVIVG